MVTFGKKRSKQFYTDTLSLSLLFFVALNSLSLNGLFVEGMYVLCCHSVVTFIFVVVGGYSARRTSVTNVYIKNDTTFFLISYFKYI